MRAFGVSMLAILLVGCDLPERVSRLEKQSQDLQAEVAKVRATSDYDLQAKCSKDARVWFNENWSRDKDTVLLDYSNHYNKKLNRCFISVEYHYDSNLGGPNASLWVNDITMWDVYENNKFGNFDENHFIYFKPAIRPEDNVVRCEVYGQKCKTVDEFNNLVRPYMSE
jgi:hypothetical protein